MRAYSHDLLLKNIRNAVQLLCSRVAQSCVLAQLNAGTSCAADLCPLCNGDEKPEQFISASQPLLSKRGNYEPVDSFPAEPTAAVGRVPTCICNTFKLKPNTRAKIVRLLQLGKVPKP